MTRSLFNFGRILTCSVLGGVVAVAIGSAGSALDVPQWGRWLRLATAMLILLRCRHC